MDIPTNGTGKSVLLSTAAADAAHPTPPQHQQPPTVLARIRRLAGDTNSISEALEGMERTISALASITRRQATEGFEIYDKVMASHHGHVATVEALASREQEANRKEKATAVREGVAQGRLRQAQEKLADAEQRASRAAALADTEARLRIEDAEKHRAEIARLTAVPVELTPKGQAVVAAAKETAAKLKAPAKAVVKDPDGHPVTNRKPTAAKASKSAVKAR